MSRFGRRRGKTVSATQIIFIIVLFAFFAAGAILVILFGARVYKSTVEKSTANYSSRTLLSYVTEKIHQNDRAGSVSVDEFDGILALVLKDADADTPYTTYIYFYDGNVRELTAVDGAEVQPDAGTAVLEAEEFVPEDLGNGLFRFTCTDAQGEKSETCVSVRSEGQADVPTDSAAGGASDDSTDSAAAGVADDAAGGVSVELADDAGEEGSS